MDPQIQPTDDEPQAPTATIVCEFCFKQFTNGKAYGGHKRIHLQPLISKQEGPQIEDQSNPQPQPSYHAMNDVTETKQIRCSLCFRFFKSWKSLFGHMRAHPERYWRGINPPPSFTNINNYNSSSSTLSEEEDDDDDDQDLVDDSSVTPSKTSLVNLTESLGRSWLTCARRGRKRLVAEDMKSAVDDLLLLAQDHHSSDQVEISQPWMVRKLEEEEEDKIPTGEAAESSEDSMAVTGAHKRKNRKLTDLVFDHENHSHLCITCNKSFPSYQALGGHMASHNKVKSMKIDQEEAAATSTSTPGRGQKLNFEDAAEHQCNICGVSFPTGQALGGHKRRHWWTSPARAPASSSSGEITTNTRLMLDFDLNEPPSEGLDS
ncbi:hypothetical protein SLE2022_020480 [Rubroshorea leprosula]